MKKKHLMLALVLLFTVNTVCMAQAQVTTTTMYNGSFTILWDTHWWWVRTYQAPARDTSVHVTMTSDVALDFWVADVGDFDDYMDGSTIYPYELKIDVTFLSYSFILEDKQKYEFILENLYFSDAHVSITIVFTYEPSASIWYVWVILGVAAVALLLFFVIRSRRKAASPVIQQTTQIYQPIQQTTQTSAYTAAQPTAPAAGAPLKFCTNCGAQSDGETKFCTNCGAAITT